MSMLPDAERVVPDGLELTELGKRLELLRIERGLSKQRLARMAGASRQQLWRVLTGKSELSLSLRHRLADALRVDPVALTDAGGAHLPDWASRLPRVLPDPSGARPSSVAVPPSRAEPLRLEDYLRDGRHLRATIATLPAGDEGRALKRALLDALEELAAARGVRLDSEFFLLRGEVVNGEV